VIAIANQKGGVGKSTTAVSLGAALAELGHRVLVVDLDPQGNASTGLGIRHEAREVTVYDVLAAEAPIEGAIIETQLQNLFAIPSTIDLAGAEIELVSQFSRELRLRRALEPLKQDSFAFVFLDCPPSLGLLTVNALAAAEELIVPIQCEYYALEGLGQLLRNVKLIQQNVNTSLRLTGIVMTMFDPRTKLSEQVVQEVRRYFGDRVYRTIIPRTVRLSEAPGFGRPITTYDPGSKGAQSYRELAKEVAERLPDDRPLPAMDDLPAPTPREPAPARAPRPMLREESLGDTQPAEELEVEEPVAVIAEPVEPALGTEGSEELEALPEQRIELATADDEVGAIGAPSSGSREPAPFEPPAQVDAAADLPPGGGVGGTGAGLEPVPESAMGITRAPPTEEPVGWLEAEGGLETEPPRAPAEPTSQEAARVGSVPEGEPERGGLIVIDEGAEVAEGQAPGQPEPEPVRRRLRGLFRRGGVR
jgi:chromosome partitioning protein